MSWLSRAVKKVGRAVDPTSSKSLVRKSVAAIDPTDKRSVVGRVTAPVVRPVVGATRAAGRAIDPASSKSVFGRAPIVGHAINSVARMGIATAKIGTGVAAFEAVGSQVAKGSRFGDYLADDTGRNVREGIKGYVTGAAVGGAVLAGKSVAGAVSDAARGAIGSASGGGTAAPATGAPEGPSAGTEHGPSFLARLIKLAFPGA